MYEMTPDYYINFPRIDDEHAYLFGLAEKTYQILGDRYVPDKYRHIKAILEELRNYTDYHFRHEEEYMESIHYKQIDSQKTRHTAFLNMLANIDLEDMMEHEQEKAIGELLKIFTNWLKYHIKDMDRLIVEDS